MTAASEDLLLDRMAEAERTAAELSGRLTSPLLNLFNHHIPCCTEGAKTSEEGAAAATISASNSTANLTEEKTTPAEDGGKPPTYAEVEPEKPDLLDMGRVPIFLFFLVCCCCFC